MSKTAHLGGRRRDLVFAFVMSGLMSLLMSAVVTLINTGLDAGFPQRWLHAFIVAWAVAFPLVSVIAPLAHRITDAVMARLTKPPQ